MSNFSPTLRALCLILSSFLGGWILMFLPLPGIFSWIGPFWMVLILVYWALMKPQYVNVGVALFVGLILDIIYNVIIGEHALVLILLVFFLTRFRQKIMPLGFWKMSLIIFGLMVFYQFLLFLMRSYVGEYFNLWSILGGAIVSVLMWSPLALLLSNFQKKLRI